jgi:hypothetical protein
MIMSSGVDGTDASQQARQTAQQNSLENLEQVAKDKKFEDQMQAAKQFINGT